MITINGTGTSPLESCQTGQQKYVQYVLVIFKFSFLSLLPFQITSEELYCNSTLCALGCLFAWKGNGPYLASCKCSRCQSFRPGLSILSPRSVKLSPRSVKLSPRVALEREAFAKVDHYSTCYKLSLDFLGEICPDH